MTNPLFPAEYARAIAKYPPEQWALLRADEMYLALLREVDELVCALQSEDVDGEHGIIREATHVQVVAQRIIDEMRTRNGRQS